MKTFTITGRKPGFAAIAFEAPGEGSPGADEAAKAAQAAADAAAAKTAEIAAQTAKTAAEMLASAKSASDDADKKAKENPGDTELQKLAADKADLLREVMDKKSKIIERDKAIEEANKKLEAYGGADPERVKALLAAEAEAEKKALEAKGEFEALRKMMADEHDRSVKELNAKLEAAQNINATNSKVIDELTLGRSFSDSKFIADNLVITPAKMRTLYGAHFEMKDGAVVGYDKPAGVAGRQVLVSASGEALSFDEAMNRIIDADPDKATLLKSKIVPGGGSITKQTPQSIKDNSNKPEVKGAARIKLALDSDK